MIVITLNKLSDLQKKIQGDLTK